MTRRLPCLLLLSDSCTNQFCPPNNDNGTLTLYVYLPVYFLTVLSAVRTAKFTTDGRCVGTGSDDCTVKLWDLATAKCLTTLSEASDNVRSQAYSPSSRQVWLTGSHDRKIRLYDLRAPRCLFTLDHGAQVNDVHMLTGGARAVSIGGDFVRVWDFFAGGKVVHEVKGHAKMVTCGATSLGNGTFCTAGLDGMVKMHDMSTFEVKMRLKFEEGIWSMDACDDGVKVAVGLGNGVVEVRSRRRGRTWLGKDVKGKEREFEGVGRGVEKTWREKKGVKKGSYRWFERGKGDGVGDGDIVMGGAGFGDRAKLKEWEKKLKRFEYGDALQEVVNNGKLVEVVQVVEELRVRGALEDAMRRNDVEVGRRLVKAVRGGVGRGVRVTELVDLVEIVMDIWGEEIGKEETLETEVRRLREVVERQVQVGRELEGLRGMAEMLLGGNGDM